MRHVPLVQPAEEDIIATPSYSSLVATRASKTNGRNRAIFSPLSPTSERSDSKPSASPPLFWIPAYNIGSKQTAILHTSEHPIKCQRLFNQHHQIHQRPLSANARHIPTKPGPGSHTHSSPPSTSQTARVVISNYTSCPQWNALMNLQVRTRYAIHLADHDQGRPPKEMDRTPSLTENLAFCTSLPQ